MQVEQNQIACWCTLKKGESNMEQLWHDLFPLSSSFNFGPSGVSQPQHYELQMIIKLRPKMMSHA